MGFDQIGVMLRWLAILCAVSVPLAVWKAAELLWWVASHVTVGLR